MRDTPDTPTSIAGTSGPLSIFRRSLGGRFSVMFLALLAPLCVVGFTISRGLTSNAEDLLEAHRIKELAVHSFALVLTQDDVTKEILLDPARISEAPRKIDAYDRNHEMLREIAVLTTDAELLRTVKAMEQLDEDTLRPLDGRIIETSVEQGREAALVIYEAEYEPLRRKYMELASQLMHHAERLAIEAEQELAARNRRSVIHVSLSLLAGTALVAGVMLVITRHIRRRLAALMDALEHVARGELRHVVEDDSPDEIGRTAAALSRAISEMREALVGVSESTNEVERQALSIAHASGAVAAVATQQGADVARASSAMAQSTHHVWGIAASARDLRTIVNGTRSTIETIDSARGGFEQRSALLLSRIEDTATAVSNMASSNAQVESSIDVLGSAANETSASAEEMAASMRSVRELVTSSEERWRAMVERGQGGLAKVQRAIEQIEELRGDTARTEAVLETLGGRTREIGAILGVIYDVVDETSLLALNASIIAAQAGGSGNAFTVVAKQIRALADRVSTHTREIEAVIRSVQDESSNAIESMARGMSGVSNVQTSAQEAGLVVQDMMRSSEESASELGHISRAVSEQSHAAEHVVELMTRTSQAVDEIRDAVVRQASEGVATLESTEVMRRAAREMGESVAGQADGLRRIASSVEGIVKATDAVEEALDAQNRSTLSVAQFLEQAEARSAENTRSAERTSDAGRELRQVVEALRRAVLRFEL